MLLHSLKLQNLLSFGPDSPEVPLGPLNVLIGPNGSGKSNFIEAISLLQAAPRSVADVIREGGGILHWMWKHRIENQILTLETVVRDKSNEIPIRYRLACSEANHSFHLEEELVERERPLPGELKPYIFYQRRPGFDGTAMVNVKGVRRHLKPESIDPTHSILFQRRDPDQYPELSGLADNFTKIKIFRRWSFGRHSELRRPQPADARNDFLEENCLNLGLVLNRIRREPKAKKQLLDGLKALYAGIDDFDVTVEGGTVQVFLQEGDITIPATRLSDGTLRYLCLLAILCHPTPPPLICIEEPELGLHPDLMPTLADLLRDASERTQIIATTHSDILVDALTETPDSILVCEKHDGSTTLQRLDQKRLGIWLEKYSLGELWRRGELGGNRW